MRGLADVLTIEAIIVLCISLVLMITVETLIIYYFIVPSQNDINTKEYYSGETRKTYIIKFILTIISIEITCICICAFIFRGEPNTDMGTANMIIDALLAYILSRTILTGAVAIFTGIL